MSNITRPITELVADVKAGKLSVVSLVQESLDAIKANEDYHAVLEVNPAALEEAKKLDEQIAAGIIDGELLGVPYIAKDNFLTVGTHTTAASKILEPFKAPYESTATQKLKDAGAILVAKANMDAFAHGSSTENSDFGRTKNPVNPAYVPGGSSGGSAAAVKLGLATFALGTDTGGSIRQPASYSGVVGLKPTYGLVSRYGVVAMASSTDCIGPMTRNIADAELVLDVIAGKDKMDSTTIDREPSYIDVVTDKKLRVGIVGEHIIGDPEDRFSKFVYDAKDMLEKQGAEVNVISLPSLHHALAAYYVLVPAEISSNLSRYDGVRFGYHAKDVSNLSELYFKSREEGLGSEAKRRILIGTYVLSSGYYDAYYKRAQKVRTKIINEFKAMFGEYDVLMGPTTPTPAFISGFIQDPIEMYRGDVMTVAANLVGIPALSVPIAEIKAQADDVMPMGLQLLADQGNENILFQVAKQLENAS